MRLLNKRYPEQAPWVMVLEGEASGEWNRLVRGNHYSVSTAEQAKEILTLLADVPQTHLTPDEWWATEPNKDAGAER